MFGDVSGCEIKDVGLENIRITGAGHAWYLGGLVGKNTGGSISNCSATGTILGGESVQYLGGLAGSSYFRSSINNCYSTGTVSGSDYVGGLVGSNYLGNISNCYSTGQVSGSGYVGGLVGYIHGNISDCYSTGAVSGSFDVGGLVGGGLCGNISNCYSTGAVSGGDRVGGLVGSVVFCGSISNCYSTGAVSGDSAVGGLVGSCVGVSVSGSFWDIQTSGKTIGVGYGDSNGVTGKMTEKMKTLSTFTSAGWDFDTIWNIVENVTYPFLREVLPSIPILKWPLAGDIGDRQVLLGFGNIWTWSYCGGLPKRHAGVDLKATKGEYVYAPEAGIIKAVLSDSGHPEWKYCVTIEHSGFTTVCWHVEPTVNVGDNVVKGQVIATVADLGTNTHLHLGVRSGSYSTNVSSVGALPQSDCSGYPAFPEQFVDPMTLSYEITQPLPLPEVKPNPESDNPQPSPLAFDTPLEISQVPVPAWYGDKSWEGLAIRILDRLVGPFFPSYLKIFVVPLYLPDPIQAQNWKGNDATATTVAVAGSNQTQTDAIKLTEASDAFIWKEVTIPQNAYGLTFDAIFLGESDGDKLMVSFDEKTLFIDDVNLFSNTVWANSGIIYIGDLAGQKGILQFRLKSEGEPNASILITNIMLTTYSHVGDLDGDMHVDLADLSILDSHWLEEDCNYPSWCEGADLNYSGFVDFTDFALFAQNWLWEKIPADIDIDGNVDFLDYALFANHWMNENCTEPSWCNGADLDKTGRVDILDLVILGDHWLEGLQEQ